MMILNKYGRPPRFYRLICAGAACVYDIYRVRVACVVPLVWVVFHDNDYN